MSNYEEVLDLLLRTEAMLTVRRSVLTETQKDKINNQLNNLKQTLFAGTYQALQNAEFSKIYGNGPMESPIKKMTPAEYVQWKKDHSSSSVEFDGTADMIEMMIVDEKQEKINKLRLLIDDRMRLVGSFAKVGCYALEQEHGAKTSELICEMDVLTKEKVAEEKVAIQRMSNANITMNPIIAAKIIKEILVKQERKKLQSAPILANEGLIKHSSDSVPALLANDCVSIPRVMAERGLDQLKKINELSKKNIIPPKELTDELVNPIIYVVEEADLKGKVIIDTENDPSVAGKPGFQVVTPAGYAKLQEFVRHKRTAITLGKVTEEGRKLAEQLFHDGLINNLERAAFNARTDERQSEDRVRRLILDEIKKVEKDCERSGFINNPLWPQVRAKLKADKSLRNEEAKKLDDIVRHVVPDPLSGWQMTDPEKYKKYKELEEKIKAKLLDQTVGSCKPGETKHWIQIVADINACPIFPGEKVYGPKTMGKSEEVTKFYTEDGRPVPVDMVEWREDGAVVKDKVTFQHKEKMKFSVMDGSRSIVMDDIIRKYQSVPRNDKADVLVAAVMSVQMMEDTECDAPMIINQKKEE